MRNFIIDGWPLKYALLDLIFLELVIPFGLFTKHKFWKSNSSRLGLEMVTYLLQPVTIVGSPLLLMDLAPLWGVALWGTASAPIMGWSSAHGKRHVYKRIRQSQILEEGSNTTFWILVIRGALALPPTQRSTYKRWIKFEPHPQKVDKRVVLKSWPCGFCIWFHADMCK